MPTRLLDPDAKEVLTDVPLLMTPQILLGSTTLPIRRGVLAVLAKLFSPLDGQHLDYRSEGNGVSVVWQNLTDRG